MKKRHQAEIYLRFLHLSEAIRGLPPLPALDPLEERLLSLVAKVSSTSVDLSVRELMGREELGSSMTNHRRLKSLRAKGWVELLDTGDSRRKRIALTREAIRHFERLSRCVVQAAKSV